MSTTKTYVVMLLLTTISAVSFAETIESFELYARVTKVSGPTADNPSGGLYCLSGDEEEGSVENWGIGTLELNQDTDEVAFFNWSATAVKLLNSETRTVFSLKIDQIYPTESYDNGDTLTNGSESLSAFYSNGNSPSFNGTLIENYSTTNKSKSSTVNCHIHYRLYGGHGELPIDSPPLETSIVNIISSKIREFTSDNSKSKNANPVFFKKSIVLGVRG